ncbi:MAG: protein kinase, partial [Pseudomonadota bacterium]
VFDLVSLNGNICLVMERLEGKTLKKLIKEEGALGSIDRVLKIMTMLADALSRAHAFNIIHRDIKPGNIFLTSFKGVDDFVKLLDFGIAFTIGGSRLTQEGMLLGTPPYISPEQIRGKEPTKASDLYSLGCVIYELLSGQTPFAGKRIDEVIKGHLFDTPAPLTDFRKDVPPELNELVIKMLQKDPDDRFMDAFELLDEMQSQALAFDYEREEMLRASEHPENERGSKEIKWGNYFEQIADDLDEESMNTKEFEQGFKAAQELAKLEKETKEIIETMERLDNRRSGYQQNIAIAVDSLEKDLSRLRKALGKDRMGYLSLVSERDHLTAQADKLITKITEMNDARHYASSNDIKEMEVSLLIETGDMGKRLSDVLEREKDLKRTRESCKGDIEDLKYQISQLNKRLYEIDDEYSREYEPCRTKLDKISAKSELLGKIAAVAAGRCDSILKVNRAGKANRVGKGEQQ